MDHPKVYYTIPSGGEAVCGYCDIVFRKKPILEEYSDNGNTSDSKPEDEGSNPSTPAK